MTKVEFKVKTRKEISLRTQRFLLSEDSQCNLIIDMIERHNS